MLRRSIRRSTGVLLILLVALTGCASGGAGTPTMRLEPVSTAGDNPFTAAVGTDQTGVTPPADAGGSFPGDTVGLFGGTKNNATCDKAKLVAFLQQDQAKAAAWAQVLGITPDQIQAFVASLTPAILRSDTRVTNHGFRDGKAFAIPAVLQAGTAVLVDVHGTPVMKCFCGNPLTPPPTDKTVRLEGPRWPNFNETNITVVVAVPQVVSQFVIVDPSSGQAFQRQAGTAGQRDAPTTVPSPSTFPSPTPSVTTPTTGGTGRPTGTVPPPGIAVPTSPSPSPTLSPLPSLTSSGPSPTTAPAAPSGTPTTPQPPTPTTPPPTTASPASPTTAPPTAQTATPSGPGTAVPPPGSPTATASATPTPTGKVRASWVIGDCFVLDGQAHGTVLVRPDGTARRTFDFHVLLGTQANPLAVETVRISAIPGQVAQSDVTAPTSTPNGRIQCSVQSVVDEGTNQPPIAGEPLPPPPDTHPMPAQPGAGAPSGSSVLVTPPAPVVPGASPS